MAKTDKTVIKSLTHLCFVLFMILFSCSIDDYDNYVVDLGGGYKYIVESRLIHSISGCNRIDIPPQIEQCKYGKRFILVKQRPDTYSYSDYKGVEKGCYKMGIDTPYYWIIDKQEQIHFGPISYDEYLHISDSLNIPVLLEK